MMKIVCISDTHEQHRKLTMPEGDILLFAGDMTWRGTSEAIKDFNDWLGELPYKHKVIIAGNHDKLFQTSPREAELLITNATYLHDSSTYIKNLNLNIHGSPWSPNFFPKQWAFNASRGSDINKYWDFIPNNTDILITHGPPYYHGDRVKRKPVKDDNPNMGDGNFAYFNDGHVGCRDLDKKVVMIQPKLHLFGHIHEDRGIWDTKRTVYCNASNYNHFTGKLSEPIVIDWIL